MNAAVLRNPGPLSGKPLRLEEVSIPQPALGEVLLRVRACGVCRTDLHIAEGELPVHRSPLVPGHQIVGEVVSSNGSTLAVGVRVGVSWLGGTDRPPYELDRAITFAPSGDVVLAALGALRKGGVVAINAIHLDRMPEFDYDQLLWGEREIRSVANMTRADAHDFLALAAEINLRPRATAYPLDRVEDALLAVKNDAVNGAAVITFGEAALPARSRGFEGATESGGAGANSHDCAGHDPILHLQSCASSRARAGRLLRANRSRGFL